MAGTFCAGGDTYNGTKNGKIKNMKAYAEGAYARTQEVSPSNPHLPSSEAAIAWEAGVGDKFTDTVSGCVAPLGPLAT